MNIKKISYEVFFEFSKQFNRHNFTTAPEWCKFKEYSSSYFEYLSVEDNGKIVSVFLLRAYKMPKLNFYLGYVPNGLFIDYSNYELLSNVTACIRKYFKKNSFFAVKFDPLMPIHKLTPYGEIVVEHNNNYEVKENLCELGYNFMGECRNNQGMQPQFTFLLDLKNKEYSDIFKNYGKSNKTRLKNIDRYVLRLEEGNVNDIDELVNLLESSGERRNFNVRQREYFELLFECYSKEQLIFKFVNFDRKTTVEKFTNKIIEIKKELEEYYDITEKSKKIKSKIRILEDQLKIQEEGLTISLEFGNEDNERIAVGIFLLDDNKMYHLYFGKNYLYNKIATGNFIIDNQIKECLVSGIETFDLYGCTGDFSKENEEHGHFKFKQSFGAELTQYMGEYDLIINKPLYNLYMMLTKKDNHTQSGFRKKIVNLVSKYK